ncbi:MAG: hypothetical protein Q9227_003500 [Pyrenula ochraceoflavens]
MPPNILLFGTGGVGTIYAYLLSQGSATVTCVCRSNYTHVSTHGFTIHSAIFGSHISFRPSRVVRSPAEASPSTTNSNDSPNEPFDYVVVCSKADPPDDATAIDLIRPAVTEGRTAIVLCQNGILIEESWRAAFPQNPIISGVVYLPVTQVSLGVISMGPLEKLLVGTYPSSLPSESAAKVAVKRFVEVFRKGGGTIEEHEDIQPARWVKVSVNAAWNTSCALARQTDSGVLESCPGHAMEAVRETMLEVIKVGNVVMAGEGKGEAELLKGGIVDEQLERAKGRVQKGNGVEPSMLTDVRMGRGLEVEAIIGNVVREAARIGVKVPRCQMLYVLTKGLDEWLRGNGVEKWKTEGEGGLPMKV